MTSFANDYISPAVLKRIDQLQQQQRRERDPVGEITSFIIEGLRAARKLRYNDTARQWAYRNRHPRIDTVQRYLETLGYTLTMIPLDSQDGD